MVEVSGGKSITFSIYGIGGKGLPAHFVDADVFNRKVRAFITALKQADKIGAIRGVGHAYYISHLKTGSAEVGVTELIVPSGYLAEAYQQYRAVSSVDRFLSVAKSVNRGDFKSLTPYADLATAILNVAKGADRNYSHIDIKPVEADALRIDSYFEQQAQKFVNLRETLEKENDEAKTSPFYSGSSHDAFDGSLKEVDLRGSTWRGKLVLTGSNVEIDCVIKGPALEDVRTNLNVRIWAEGLAIYSKKSGLPQRLEVSRMRSINTAADLRRWRAKLTADETGGDEGAWSGQQ